MFVLGIQALLDNFVSVAPGSHDFFVFDVPLLAYVEYFPQSEV
jgi:hypothetical protein